ncbi:acylphosphatase [Acidovorax sp.]|uniref:acylphosphatase n=1 Tax=Acidovorax sp. TaxID=1872122 RepID=UPI0027BAAD86|nr:acylphosphatase [Acidovorax sp.]
MHAPCSSKSASTITRHLHIRGHVQGVSYRWSMVQTALQRGVQGWVRRHRDGGMEALATSSADAVQFLIDWAQQGPAHARVDAVQVCSVAEPAEPRASIVQRDTV